MAMMIAAVIVIADRKLIQYSLFNFIKYCIAKFKMSNKLTNNICAASNPILKESRGTVRLSSSININRIVFAKPRPWINPKPSAIR